MLALFVPSASAPTVPAFLSVAPVHEPVVQSVVSLTAMMPVTVTVADCRGGATATSFEQSWCSERERERESELRGRGGAPATAERWSVPVGRRPTIRFVAGHRQLALPLDLQEELTRCSELRDAAEQERVGCVRGVGVPPSARTVLAEMLMGEIFEIWYGDESEPTAAIAPCCTPSTLSFAW